MELTDDYIAECLDGFFAYDNGCIDSGIKNDVLKEQIRQSFLEMNNKRLDKILREFVDHYFNETYGLAEVKKAILWVENTFEIGDEYYSL